MPEPGRSGKNPGSGKNTISKRDKSAALVGKFESYRSFSRLNLFFAFLACVLNATGRLELFGPFWKTTVIIPCDSLASGLRFFVEDMKCLK